MPHANAPSISSWPQSSFAEPDVTLSLDVVVTRGELIESRHRVHAAVVDSTGRLLAGARDALRPTWWRSCAKPFQVLPMIERNLFTGLSWGNAELAMACASHGGEPEHVALAAAMLERVGLSEVDLACGPHEPLSGRGAKLLRESGLRVSRLHNNCSGKHAAMLARSVLDGLSTAGYHEPTHPVQVDAHHTVAMWAGLSPGAIPVARDGCGVTVFALPLANMALSYARLGRAARQGEDAPAQVVAAMTGRPFLVGGSDRFDTVLMEACDKRVLCKIGAEGVHTLSLLSRDIGVAVKAEDGATRAQYPAVLALLSALGELPATLPQALQKFQPRVLTNTRGDEVGELRVDALDVDRLRSVVGVPC